MAGMLVRSNLAMDVGASRVERERRTQKVPWHHAHTAANLNLAKKDSEAFKKRIWEDDDGQPTEECEEGGAPEDASAAYQARKKDIGQANKDLKWVGRMGIEVG